MLACRGGFDLFYVGVGVGWHVGVFVEMCEVFWVLCVTVCFYYIVMGPMCVCVCVCVQRFSLGSECSLGVFVERGVWSPSVTVMGMCGREGSL